MDLTQKSHKVLLIGGIALVIAIILVLIVLSAQQAEYLKTGVITPGISPLPSSPPSFDPELPPPPPLGQCRNAALIKADDATIDSCNPCEPDVPSLCVAEDEITICPKNDLSCTARSYPPRRGECKYALGYDSSKSCEDQRVRSVRECAESTPPPFTFSPCLELPGLPCPSPHIFTPTCKPIVSTAHRTEIKCVMDEEAGEEKWIVLKNPDDPNVDYNQCNGELSYSDISLLESLPSEDRAGKLEEICKTRSAVMHEWFWLPYWLPHEKHWPPPTTTFSCRPKYKSSETPTPGTPESTPSPTPTPPPTPTPTPSPTPTPPPTPTPTPSPTPSAYPF